MIGKEPLVGFLSEYRFTSLPYFYGGVKVSTGIMNGRKRVERAKALKTSHLKLNANKNTNANLAYAA